MTEVLQIGGQEGMVTALLQIIANDNVELSVFNASPRVFFMSYYSAVPLVKLVRST